MVDGEETKTKIDISLSINEIDLIRRMSFNNEDLLSEHITNPKSIYYSFSHNDEVKRNLYFDSATLRHKLIKIVSDSKLDWDESKYETKDPT